MNKEQNVHFQEETTPENQTFEGKVIHGMALGRTIGYPTANMDVSTPILLRGVFVVRLFIPTLRLYYYGIMNVGTRPSLNLQQLSIEVHIFEFHGNIYGENIQIIVLEKLRNEKKFNSIEELQKQISIDVSNAKTIIANI